MLSTVSQNGMAMRSSSAEISMTQANAALSVNKEDLRCLTVEQTVA